MRLPREQSAPLIVTNLAKDPGHFVTPGSIFVDRVADGDTRKYATLAMPEGGPECPSKCFVRSGTKTGI